MRKVYRLSDAIDKVANYGMVNVCVGEDDLKYNPFVRIIQDWWPSGCEVARFIRVHGKYRGNSLGFAINPNNL